MASARRIAARAVMLHGGRNVWTGPTAMLGRSGDPHVDAFARAFGDGPPMEGMTHD